MFYRVYFNGKIVLESKSVKKTVETYNSNIKNNEHGISTIVRVKDGKETILERYWF